MTATLHGLRRKAYATVAAMSVFAFGVSMVLPHFASAAQVGTRSMTMSTSATSQTASYKLTFTPASNFQELVVDFCSDTPFIGATCNFDAATVPTVTGVTSTPGTAATVGSGSPVHTVRVIGLSGTAGTPITVTLNNVTNPTSVGTFYARIITYATGNATGYVPANSTGGTTTVGTSIDYGGIALATAAQIDITAKVMESLSFCVYAASGVCGTAPSITLGHGTNTTLDSTAVDTKDVAFDLSTNALTGAVVAMKGDTLKNGGNVLAAAGTTPVAITPGSTTAQFGMRISASSAGITASAPYNHATNYGLDISSATNITSQYGQQICSTAGPINGASATLTFAATAATTTPAGIYTATENLIATGTF